MSLKKEMSGLLSNISDLMEYKGENKFKISAFKNGANTIRRIEGDLETMIADDKLKDVKGIGKGILKVINEYIETGKSSEFEELSSNIPEGITELFSIRGIGPRKVRTLHDELAVGSLEQLEHVCRENKVAGLKGFGEKLQQKILDEVLRLKRSRGYMLLNKALEIGETFSKMLHQHEIVKKVEFTGQIRRILEVISKIELICVIDNYKSNYVKLSNLFEINKLSEDNSCIKLEIKDADNHLATMFVTDQEEFVKVWFSSTGSDDFISNFPQDFDEKSYKSEDELFKKLGKSFVIPEMREGAYWNAPENLRENSKLSIENFRGLLHFHTTKSDGQNTLSEMVDGARSFGFEYLAVCDHSQSAFYANGLTEDRILLQKKEIDEVVKASGITIYHGIESDILRDGSLDYPDDILRTFDFVVASIHSIFELSEEEMTNRMIRAIENPFTDLIAHPTGRLLLARDPYRTDIKRIIDACAANDVAIEINANPSRLDLDWRNIYYARQKGCKFAINPDAHSIEGIADTNYGIMIAKKGGIQPEEVINCYTEEQFNQFINRKITRKK